MEIYKLIENIICVLSKVNWDEFAKILIAIWTASIATMALRTWKLQLRANKQTDFLDDLTHEIHELVNKIASPIETLKFSHIFIDTYSRIPEDKKRDGFIKFVETNGSELSDQFILGLNECSSSVNKIKMLTTKGQVFGFKNYNECWNSCNQIVHQFERIQSFAYFIKMNFLNWENEEILNTIDIMLSLEHEEIRRMIENQNVIFLTFVKENYKTVCN